MSKSIEIDYTCPECDNEVKVLVEPSIPAKIWGPPESCYPAEGGDFEPGECPHCGTEFDTDKILDRAEEKAEDRYHDYPEDDDR